MKFITFLFLMLSLSSPTVQSQNANLGSIRVVIEGMKSQQGLLRVSLEKSAADFDKGALHESHYRGEAKVINTSPMEIVFQDVPYGTYAIKTFHDADSNGQLNTNLLGVPAEDYGFSNNARSSFGPAKFKEASFELNSSEKLLSIRIK